MPRNLFFLLSAFYFFFFAIIGVYVIYMPKVLDSFGYTSAQIGVIFAMSPLVRFLAPFFFLKKQLTATIYKAALLGLLISGAALYVTIENFWLLVLNNILIGIAFALILPFAETIALEKIGKERYGRARLWGSLGFIFVALVVAKFMQKPYTALHFFMAMVILTAIFAAYLPQFESKKLQHPKSKSFNFLSHWPLWANLFLMQVSFAPFYNFFTIYEHEHGLDYTTISYLWTFGVVCEIVMLYLQAPLMRKNLLSLIKFSTFVTIFRWLLLFLFPTNVFMLYLAQSLHAFGFALYYSSAIAYLFTLYEDKKLAQLFFGGISFGLGGMVGSFLAGLFYGEYLFLYASTVAFLAWVVLLIRR